MCDAQTEQVHEPHLNNTYTHTLTLTHYHPLYMCGASSSWFSMVLENTQMFYLQNFNFIWLSLQILTYKIVNHSPKALILVC